MSDLTTHQRNSLLVYLADRTDHVAYALDDSLRRRLAAVRAFREKTGARLEQRVVDVKWMIDAIERDDANAACLPRLRKELEAASKESTEYAVKAALLRRWLLDTDSDLAAMALTAPTMLSDVGLFCDLPAQERADKADKRWERRLKRKQTE